jgi:nucleotide-binding universal stress UspA family protein
MITATAPRSPHRRPRTTSHSSVKPDRLVPMEPAPIVVAVDDSSATEAAAQSGVRLARELGAPLVFVYVRRGPWSGLGTPYYQRRLDAELNAGRSALDEALAVAERAGVSASAEHLAGNPARRVVEFARLRGARLVVLGSRRRRLGRSVSRAVIRGADRPVMVAAPAAPLAG